MTTGKVNSSPSAKQGVRPLGRLLSVPAVISFVVAAAFLYFLVSRFNVDLGATWDQVRGSNPWLYLAALLCYYLSFPPRGLRWRIMAGSAGIGKGPGQRLPSAWQASLLILIGWFANSVGWLRMGDAYRAYAFAESSKASFSASLGTVAAERVLDVMVVFFLLLVAVAGMVGLREASPSPFFLLLALVLVVAGVLALLVMARFGHRLARLLPGPLRRAYGHFHQGALGSLRQLPQVGFLGTLGWLFEVGRLFLVIQALGLSVPLPLVLFVGLVNAILTTVPFTPGGLGIVEPGIVGLLVLALPRDSAISVAVLDRSISYVSVILFGALAFGIRQAVLARRRAKGPLTTQSEP
ncbi:MAG: flippase-like domain-containing protein [Chloroflexi bacterium]|nr:flippase-like domain-containing protein [Chloroflexota bacterium]